MYLDVKRKLAFYAHPRTASCSTSRWLKENGFELVGKHHGREPVPLGVRSFTVVRNPWDVAVSWVFSHERGKDPGGWSAELFADHMREGRNSYVRAGRLFWHQVDETLRFETLEQDLSRVLGEPVELEHRNRSDGRRGRHYSEFYDTAAAAFIGLRFAPEIELYGYTFERRDCG